MTDREPGSGSSARDLIAAMDWEELPYDCVGLLRSKRVSDTRIVWSWLILVPWAVNDSKPFIDGVELINNPLMKEEAQRDKVLTVMRTALDERYGKSVGSRAVDDFLKELEDDG